MSSSKGPCNVHTGPSSEVLAGRVGYHTVRVPGDRASEIGVMQLRQIVGTYATLQRIKRDETPNVLNLSCRM